MEIFYSSFTDGRTVRLDPGESTHCVRVLRHRTGDEIAVVDGDGNMMRCRLANDSPKGAEATVLEVLPHWGAHPYHLTMAVCPTKNNDRYEWFVEKVTELGVDVIVPVIGERSERKTFKPERCRKVALSAMKQSLKASLPVIEEQMGVKDFIRKAEGIRLICCCFDGDAPRKSVTEALEETRPDCSVSILIGPEGDFSPEELKLAVDCGFVPVHLGPSRLRTETAALTAAAAVYINFIH